MDNPLLEAGFGRRIVMNAVIAIVTGIKNSMRSEFTLINLNVASAKVTEWPIVKAVTKITTLRQSLGIKTAQSAKTKSMWS